MLFQVQARQSNTTLLAGRQILAEYILETTQTYLGQRRSEITAH